MKKKDEKENEFAGYRVTKDIWFLYDEGWERVLESLSDNKNSSVFNFMDLCEAWLDASGFRWDDEKEMWYDEDNKEYLEGSENVDAETLVFNLNYQEDVLVWAFENNFIEYRIYNSGREGWFFNSDAIISYSEKK